MIGYNNVRNSTTKWTFISIEFLEPRCIHLNTSVQVKVAVYFIIDTFIGNILFELPQPLKYSRLLFEGQQHLQPHVQTTAIRTEYMRVTRPSNRGQVKERTLVSTWPLHEDKFKIDIFQLNKSNLLNCNTNNYVNNKQHHTKHADVSEQLSISIVCYYVIYSITAIYVYGFMNQIKNVASYIHICFKIT